jgi:hypothetical protein
MFDEVGSVGVLSELKLAESENFCNRLDTGTNRSLDFLSFWQLC